MTDDHAENEHAGFTPFTEDERQELAEKAFKAHLGRRLQAHILTHAVLRDLDTGEEEIRRLITESPDGGRGRADEEFTKLPEERQRVLREAAARMTTEAIWQAVRQHEQACNQLKIDPRFETSGPELIALLAATPVVLGGIVFTRQD